MLRAHVLPLVALTACSFGTPVETYRPAATPAGATVELRTTRDTSFTGELLAVSDSGFLLLGAKVLVFAPYPAMKHVAFPDVGVGYRHGARPDSTDFAHLRLVSRYPQGVSGERLRQLLAANGKDSVVVLKP